MPEPESEFFKEARNKMVEEQIVGRGITDKRVIEAMRRVPRHRFVDEQLWDRAYEDRPLPIGHKQTISQPYIVAFMTQALKFPADGSGTVLEVGTGSGYQAAILSHLAEYVFTVERVEALGRRVRMLLPKLNIENVSVKISDGGYGWSEHAPYDRIIVTAAAPYIPAPLKAQLAEGGYLISPVGARGNQSLTRLRRHGDEFEEEHLAPVAFVPLLGEHGWDK